MKLVINGDYGGWSLISDRAREICEEEKRAEPEVIKFVEQNPDECGDLKIIVLPDETTDWEVIEDDGREFVVYVVDGKIYWKS